MLREFRLQNDDVPLPQESDRGETGGGGKYGRRLDLRITKNFVYSDTGGDIHGIGLVLLRLESAWTFSGTQPPDVPEMMWGVARR